jgi:hypothetical protein
MSDSPFRTIVTCSLGQLDDAHGNGCPFHGRSHLPQGFQFPFRRLALVTGLDILIHSICCKHLNIGGVSVVLFVETLDILLV